MFTIIEYYTMIGFLPFGLSQSKPEKAGSSNSLDRCENQALYHCVRIYYFTRVQSLSIEDSRILPKANST